MNEKQYLQICKLTDSIIQRKDTTISRIAIQFLFPLRPHPLYLSPYYDLFTNKRKNILFSIIKYFFLFFKFSYRIINSIFFRENYSNKYSNVSHFFISHLLNESQIESENDFYYGTLPQQLANKGLKSSIILISHIKNQNSIKYKEWEINGISKLILIDKVCFLDEIKITYKLIIEHLRLRNLSKKSNIILEKKLLSKASDNALSDSTFSNMRIGYNIKNILSKSDPKILITTFEGYAWERVVFAQLKNNYKKIKCIGYNHSALFNLQHSIFRSIDSKIDPDKIFTVGESYNNIFKNLSNFNDIKIEILGSPKFNSINFSEKTSNITILCIPEGLISECLMLFDFSIKCSILNPTINFIWRVHPLIKIDQIKKYYKILPKNISISKNNIQSDILMSNYVLYRGSSAVIEAFNYGLIPIYYNNNSFNIDPLYYIDCNKNYINNENELSSMINNNCKNKKVSNLQNLYSPLNINVIIND